MPSGNQPAVWTQYAQPKIKTRKSFFFSKKTYENCIYVTRFVKSLYTLFYQAGGLRGASHGDGQKGPGVGRGHRGSEIWIPCDHPTPTPPGMVGGGRGVVRAFQSPNLPKPLISIPQTQTPYFCFPRSCSSLNLAA